LWRWNQASDRNPLQKRIERARVVLASAQRGPEQRVAALLGSDARWCAAKGVDGPLRDKTRKPGMPPIAAETVARMVAVTCADPPHEATHSSGRAIAKATGISLRSTDCLYPWPGLGKGSGRESGRGGA